MSPVPSPFPTPRTNVTSPGLTTVAPLPEVEAVQDILMTMKGALSALGMTFDSLGEQTSKVAALGPALENAQQINILRGHIQQQDLRQEAKIDEIKVLLKDVLQHEIVDHLRGKVAEHINDQIEEQVRAQVEHQLTHHIPVTLQDQVDEHKRQLEDVKRALHNSESRRANSLLRSNHLGDPLHSLLMTSGEASALFPKDLTALFALDGPTAKQLLADYGLSDLGDSREKNLNKLMQFCGVAYQMVSYVPS
ncbi:hypothetical protein BU17DRAFT_77019 [Hysterangium stoloniferum]|nr:hypothetical protein BU17DRAFT_77019 [Hysterangium stoloniferum]